MSNILVSITNYDFSDNADLLKNQFAQKFDTIIIDSSSQKPPKNTDIVIENNYYPGLWNASVNYAIKKKYEWLFFIASDIEFIFPQKIEDSFGTIAEVIKDPTLGAYTASVLKKSRCAFSELICQNTNNIRILDTYIEGFMFLCRTSILDKLYPINYTINKYGYNLDIIMCRIARYMGYKVVVDDRLCVYHPPAIHTIGRTLAFKQGKEYEKLYEMYESHE